MAILGRNFEYTHTKLILMQIILDKKCGYAILVTVTSNHPQFTEAKSGPPNGVVTGDGMIAKVPPVH